MFELKPIDKESIPRALAKAERYRLLNEPREAESICLDVLSADPANQDATICLILSLTDLFETGQAVEEVRRLASSLKDPYNREYFCGVVEERWAKALLHGGYTIGSVYDLIASAMGCFGRADRIAPNGNDDAVLRWNTCVRLLQRANFEPVVEEGDSCDLFNDDVPTR